MPSLIGTDPNQLPTNGDLGTMAFQDADNYNTNKLSASVTPQLNTEMKFELTSNTSLTVKVKGTDGTVRSVILTLA
ncbi:MAG: hypothetical protein Q7U57_14420 [Methylovulum sp.]|nr:hypothetical protein [Methylovulum sp.]